MRKTTYAVFTILSFICILNFPLLAQDLHIYYDAQTENIRYEIEGEEIKVPKVKKDQDVFVHVQNYNNYLYDLDVKANQKTIRITQPMATGSNGGGMGMTGMGGGGLFDMWVSGALNSYNNLGGLDDGPGFGDNSLESAQLTKLLDEYEMTVKDMAQVEKQLQVIRKEINAFKDSRAIKDLVMRENEKIKFNPYLKPEQVRTMLQENLEKALEKKHDEEITLEEIIAKSDNQKRLEGLAENLNAKHRLYKKHIYTLADINDQMDDFGFVDPLFIEIKEDISMVYDNSKEVESSIKKQKQELIQIGENAQKNDIEQYLALRMEREALKANDFAYTYRTKASGDHLELNIKFNPKDSSSFVRSPSKPIEVAPIEVPVFGGLKINASVGISFGQYFNRPQHYFLKDSTIAGRNMDSFSPYLTSFFHFYTQKAKQVSIAGSFGIGIPLGNSNVLQSATFFLGPSLIIGKGDRIVINTGVLGGRVQKLDQGFEKGDVFRSDGDAIPVHYPYELGYYLGLSFNIGGN